MAHVRPDNQVTQSQLLARGLAVLECVATQDSPIGVGEVARLVELPKSTVQRILRTLDELEWIEATNDPVTRWQLSDRLLALSRQVPRPLDIRQAALPHMRKLNEQTKETIHFSVLDLAARGTILIERVDSPLPVRSFNQIGAAAPLYASGTGWAILAAMSDDEVDQILSEELIPVHESRSIDTNALRREIDLTRAQGYAVAEEAWREGVCAIGAAVLDDHRRPVASLVISMPKQRFTRNKAKAWGPAVVETAAAISRDFNHS